MQDVCGKGMFHNQCYIALKKNIPSFSQLVTPAEGIFHGTSSLCRIATVQNASVNAKTIFSALDAPMLRCNFHRQLFLYPY